MGDLRADIKIQMNLIGEDYKMDCWINYWPEPETGIDERVREWFENCWQDAKAKYDDYRWEQDRERREAQTKADELAKLAELKAKYE